jgi:hypothetical protein
MTIASLYHITRLLVLTEEVYNEVINHSLGGEMVDTRDSKSRAL